MNLNQWMEANGLTDTKVGEITGLHRTAVWKLRRGLRKPGPKVMDELVRASHGAVTRPELRPDLYPDEGKRSSR